MKRTLVIVAVWAALAGAACGDAQSVRVVGQRVNLRARADLKAEVVAQAAEGDLLLVKSIQDEWVEVAPPEHVDLWVNKDLVNGNRVSVSRANVRAGPGVNYTVVGALVRDEVVAAKGSFGEWLRIAPFPSASLWVSRELVNLPTPTAASNALPSVADAPPSGEPEGETPPDNEIDAPPAAAARVPPADLKLVPLEGQGRVVEHQGQLKPSGYALGAPGEYRLVRHVGRAYETIVYLRGNPEQLKSLLDRQMRVAGAEYWVERVREPVLVVEKIRLLEGQPNP